MLHSGNAEFTYTHITVALSLVMRHLQTIYNISAAITEFIRIMYTISANNYFLFRPVNTCDIIDFPKFTI